ncbi:MAG: hypothetical protein ACJAU2_001077 [Maribacter sp.]|jgi:hypothetical protein
MEDYCLHIGKLVTEIGLILDILGVIILVGIEITSHKIEYLKDNPYENFKFLNSPNKMRRIGMEFTTNRTLRWTRS